MQKPEGNLIKMSQNTTNSNTMKSNKIDAQRDENGIYSAENELAGWYAISRDNVHMITYVNTDKIKFYTKKGFERRITQLCKRGY
jgi:hypothetical protein